MELAIDIGNTTVKAAVFGSPEETAGTSLRVRNPLKYTRLERHDPEALSRFVEDCDIDRCLISATADITEDMHDCFMRISHGSAEYLTHETRIPIINQYATPQTLGPDRLAAAIGAYALARETDPQRHSPLLIIDSGTAITYDFVTADGRYLGGNISPGLEMRFHALHAFTAHLPYINKTEWQQTEEDKQTLIGNTTVTAIEHGVIDGVCNEIVGTIRQFVLKYPNVLVFLTGGDGFRFEETLKKRIFAEKFLVLKGLDIIIRHNQNQKQQQE